MGEAGESRAVLTRRFFTGRRGGGETSSWSTGEGDKEVDSCLTALCRGLVCE